MTETNNAIPNALSEPSESETLERIKEIATTGNVNMQWNELQASLKSRLEQVIETYQERKNCKENQKDEPNVEKFNLDYSRDEIMELFASFTEPPFTIQRICELLSWPFKYYDKLGSFLRGLEKNLRVISSNDWPKCPPPPPPAPSAVSITSVTSITTTTSSSTTTTTTNANHCVKTDHSEAASAPQRPLGNEDDEAVDATSTTTTTMTAAEAAATTTSASTTTTNNSNEDDHVDTDQAAVVVSGEDDNNNQAQAGGEGQLLPEEAQKQSSVEMSQDDDGVGGGGEGFGSEEVNNEAVVGSSEGVTTASESTAEEPMT